VARVRVPSGIEVTIYLPYPPYLPYLPSRTETVRVLKAHDPAVEMPDTIAGWHARWWAKFHGCRDVLEMVSPSKG